EDLPADGGPQRFFDGAFLLDREIGDAARGIHLARRKCFGGTGIDAARAGTAAVCGRKRPCLLGKVERRDDDSEQQPRAEPFVEDAGVFADPADAGTLRILALHDWPGVNVAACLEVGTKTLMEGVLDGAQLCKKDLMVVTARVVVMRASAPRVACNPPCTGRSIVDRTRCVGVVVDGTDHDGARPGHGAMEVAANELAGSVEAFQPLHLAGAAGGNPRGKTVPGFEARRSSFDRNF